MQSFPLFCSLFPSMALLVLRRFTPPDTSARRQPPREILRPELSGRGSRFRESMLLVAFLDRTNSSHRPRLRLCPTSPAARRKRRRGQPVDRQRAGQKLKDCAMPVCSVLSSVMSCRFPMLFCRTCLITAEPAGMFFASDKFNSREPRRLRTTAS
jgi:hypothetical protein